MYMGIIRIQGCTACCKRWYFTFNTEECTKPAPIDAVIYQSINMNVHRSANIEGYCGGIPAGKVATSRLKCLKKKQRCWVYKGAVELPKRMVYCRAEPCKELNNKWFKMTLVQFFMSCYPKQEKQLLQKRIPPNPRVLLSWKIALKLCSACKSRYSWCKFKLVSLHLK